VSMQLDGDSGRTSRKPPLTVAYVTYRVEPDRPDPDPDIERLANAFQRLGARAQIVAWDDSAVDWSSFDGAVLRSTWDYAPRYSEFMAWATRAAAVTRLVNPLEVVQRNTDKSYLLRLAAAGVPIVPTLLLKPGDEPDIEATGWQRIVVKPSISSGARDTILTTDPRAANAHVRSLLGNGRSALVQPYLDAVDAEGEIAVVVIGGRISHAVRKVPALTEGGYGDASETFAVTIALAEAVERVLDAEPGARDLAYARVDMVRDPQLGWVVMELELAEPLLFLGHDPRASDRLAAAVIAAIAA
jgi:glutathione synthase/RimK-type ligase-like ATP-grasp enzyme